MHLDLLDFVLPEALIAQYPCAARSQARLLCLQRHGQRWQHRLVQDLPRSLPPSLIIANDSQVVRARLQGRRPTGGRVEVLLLRCLEVQADQERWCAMLRPGKTLRPGMVLRFGPEGVLQAEVLAGAGLEREVVLRSAKPHTAVTELRTTLGALPLPPYIRRPATAADAERYQTVFARHAGSVAAPTAGLHFSAPLLQALRAAGHWWHTITLHVGPGTFRPVRTSELRDHVMHHEHYDIPAATAAAIATAKSVGRPVLAVGTTVVRTLEAAAREPGGLQAGPGCTDLLINPPFEFRVVDQLMTNFHLPKSTLLALVMAFAGIETTRAAYAAAVHEQYRFFSYGDAMLVTAAGTVSSGGRQSDALC